MFRTVSAAAVLLGVGLGVAACAGSAAQSMNQPIGYLQRAQAAAQAHDTATTLAALNGAENTWLVTAAARSNPCMYNSAPTLRAIGYARASVQGARWRDAEHYIGTALNGVGAPDAG